MARRDAHSLERLAAIGVDVWQAKAPVRPEAGANSPEPDDRIRIRLSSGDGDWLLVQRQPWRGNHEQLLADIMATIGTRRCRFGQWATDSASGEGHNDLAGRGVSTVLAFGPPPRALDWPNLLLAPALDELASDPAARFRLWQLLSPVLKSA